VPAEPSKGLRTSFRFCRRPKCRGERAPFAWMTKGEPSLCPIQHSIATQCTHGLVRCAPSTDLTNANTPRARYANQRDRAFSLPGGLHQPNEATDGKRTRQLPVAVSAWRLSPRRYIAHRHVLALTSRHRRTPRERGASTCNVASCCPGLAPGACDVGRRSQQHLSSTRKRRGPAISRAVRGTPNPRWGIAAALEGVSDAVSSRGAPASKPRRGRDDGSTCRRSCTLTTNTPTH